MKKRIYLDNAATSFPKPEGVVNAVTDFIVNVGSNINRGSYGSAYCAEDVVYDTRKRLCKMFGGPKAKNVVFTSGITLSLNMVIKGLLSKGDHVIVSPMEHNAVMRPLTQLIENEIEFSRFKCDSCGYPMKSEPDDMSYLEECIRPNTKAVITTHASNVSGTVMPIKEIGRFCREHNLIFIVDTAQTAGVLDIDMAGDSIDVLCFTGHKGLMGPQGIGGFIVTDRVAKLMKPTVTGGTGSISHLETTPDFMPDKFEPGTLNLPGIYGLHAALEYIDEIGIDKIAEKENELSTLFVSQVKKIPGIRIIGHDNKSEYVSVVSINCEGIDAAKAAYRLDEEYGIQTRVGMHCAPSAHQTIETYPNGTLRFSFGYFTTEEEVLLAVRAMSEIMADVVKH